MGAAAVPITSRCLAEALGTFLLIFLGCGAVHADLAGALSGLWQIAIVWAIAIMLAIQIVGSISGAHINPAMTVAFAVWGRFRWRYVLPYILAQLIGAALAAAVLFAFYSPMLTDKEQEKQVVRGETGSEITAKCYGEYFPKVSEPLAITAEVLGTLILSLVVFAVTDPRNAAAPPDRLAPVFIGLAVAALIVVIAPLTQACFNPARDFGPRLFAGGAGWGSIAFGRGTGFLTVYIIAPTIGAILGGGLYHRILQPRFPQMTPESQDV